MAKKRIAITSFAFAIILLLCIAINSFFKGPIIGTVSGAENEFIVIDGITYIIDDLAENGDITMRVYSVKEDDSGNYLYALWEWEGNFYVRQN